MRKDRPDDWVNPHKESFYLGEANAPDNIWEPIYCLNTLNGWGHEAFEAGADALIAAGYRPVPSVEEIKTKVASFIRSKCCPESLISDEGLVPTVVAEQIYDWLLGDKE